MPKYTHDTERWLRSNAELYRRMGNQQMARNFELCAEDVKSLLARVAMLEDALRDAERVLEWGEPQPKPVLERVRRALEEK